MIRRHGLQLCSQERGGNKMASVIRAHHRGAKFVSAVFKVVAIVILLGGIIGGIAAANTSNNVNTTFGSTSSGSSGGAIAIFIIIAAIIGAASVLFFAYVLDLLMSIDVSTAAAGPTMVTPNMPTSSSPLTATAIPTPAPTLTATAIPTPAHAPTATATATAMPTPAHAPKRAPVYPEPGWFPDPHGVVRARYWDGQMWTDKTQM